jgi:uncharacterized protein with HEPN domain
MSEREILFLLEDIEEAAQRIKKYTANYDFDRFCKDQKTIDAVVRNFEIIGEASNRIDADFKLSHPEIEWRRMKGLRNRLIHEYFGVDIEIIWLIINEYLDDLHENIASLIEDLNS